MAGVSAPSAAALVSEAHGLCSRALADRVGVYEGLSASAKAAQLAGVISPRFRKKLERLDHAFAITRHISGPRVDAFLEELRLDMAGIRPSRSRTGRPPRALAADPCWTGSDLWEPASSGPEPAPTLSQPVPVVATLAAHTESLPCRSIGVGFSGPKRRSLATGPSVAMPGDTMDREAQTSVSLAPITVVAAPSGGSGDAGLTIDPLTIHDPWAQVQTLPAVVESVQGSGISGTAAITDFFHVGVQVTGPFPGVGFVAHIASGDNEGLLEIGGPGGHQLFSPNQLRLLPRVGVASSSGASTSSWDSGHWQPHRPYASSSTSRWSTSGWNPSSWSSEHRRHR